MKLLRITLLLPIILLSLAINPAFADEGPVEEMKMFVEAYNKQDASGVADLFHEDGKLLPAGKPMISGREAIEAYWKGSYDAGLSNIEKTSIEFVVSGDLAVETSSYIVTFKDLKINGKDTLVWRKSSEGEWKISTDIWASDQ
uniref:DUF4440 domain-containing protein n=1 Tax=uncultured Thiotrichaceae bacterium TaxID=298394 RepID=A0A6S6UBC1_9GAMM|nr:MAG: Unknown protein [uncultured Thiotrichaceae bacterium]